VLFWSGIWCGKLLFLKIILKRFASTSDMSFGYIYTVELRLYDHPLDGTHGRVHTCIPKSFKYYRDHFISKILSLIESYLAVLRAAIAGADPTSKFRGGDFRLDFGNQVSLPVDYCKPN